jgi:hypothetical protein
VGSNLGHVADYLKSIFSVVLSPLWEMLQFIPVVVEALLPTCISICLHPYTIRQLAKQILAAPLNKTEELSVELSTTREATSCPAIR